MSFNTQPSSAQHHGILSEYQNGTLLYEFETTVIANENAPALTVETWINGAKFHETDIDGFDNRTQNGSDYDYTYKLDLSDIVTDFFDFDNFYNQTGIHQNANLQANLQLKIYVWSPDVDGKLTKGASTIDSNIVTVLPALISDLSDYTKNLGRKFLTNEPIQTIYFLSQNKYIALKTDAFTTHLRVRTYNSDSSLTHTAFFDLSASNEVTLISLNNEDLEGYTNLGAGTLDISSNKFFRVDAGTLINDAFSLYTETREYYVFDYDVYLRIKQLDFVNMFGFQDTFYLTRNEHTTSQNTQYETYQKRNVGFQIINGEIQKSVSIQLQSLDNEDFNWMNDIKISSRFYIDDVQYFTDKQEGIIEDIDNSNNIRLVLKESLISKTHSN